MSSAKWLTDSTTNLSMSISAITKDKFTSKPGEVDEMSSRRQSGDEEDDAEHNDENCNGQEKSNGNSSKEGRQCSKE